MLSGLQPISKTKNIHTQENEWCLERNLVTKAPLHNNFVTYLNIYYIIAYFKCLYGNGENINLNEVQW